MFIFCIIKNKEENDYDEYVSKFYTIYLKMVNKSGKGPDLEDIIILPEIIMKGWGMYITNYLLIGYVLTVKQSCFIGNYTNLLPRWESCITKIYKST